MKDETSLAAESIGEGWVPRTDEERVWALNKATDALVALFETPEYRAFLHFSRALKEGRE